MATTEIQDTLILEDQGSETIATSPSDLNAATSLSVAADIVTAGDGSINAIV